MKTLTLILSILLFVSCQKEDQCECYKNYHEIETIIYWENGLPKTRVIDNLVASEKILCQDETRVYTSGYTYYDIECN